MTAAILNRAGTRKALGGGGREGRFEVIVFKSRLAVGNRGVVAGLSVDEGCEGGGKKVMLNLVMRGRALIGYYIIRLESLRP
jgi:hypothetical protein